MNRTIKLFLPLLALLLAGCLSEGSFPMVPEHLAHMAPSAHLSTRTWAVKMHEAAADRLPLDRRGALLTDQLSDGDGAVKVWPHFGLKEEKLDDLFGNLHGIEETAQATSPAPKIEGGHVQRGPWKGFLEVEVPVSNGAMLYGRLGTPEKEIANAYAAEMADSFVILTHGLFGSLDGYDIENHAQALRRMGHHVLALEMRGHGETNCRHPEYAITFGIMETGDLIAADRWLRTTYGARRVGLVCFSLTGYEAMLTGWLDGKKPVDDFSGEALLKLLPKRGDPPAFNAGMFIVSAPIGIVNMAFTFGQRYSALEAPVKSTFQNRVAARLAAYGDPPGYSMWNLAEAEFKRSGLEASYSSFDVAKPTFIKFVDFSSDGWRAGAERMENVRVPMLVLSAANDPLGSAQCVAELFSRQNNPNIGVIMLREGGHMGFSALSADYYYSLMANFFDPRTCPVAQ